MQLQLVAGSWLLLRNFVMKLHINDIPGYISASGSVLKFRSGL